MDECSGQRAGGGLAISRRGSSLSFRESNHEDRNIQYCNRLGCSTRLNSMKGTNSVNQEKAKYSKPSFPSSSSRTTVGSSSKSLAGMSNLRKHHLEQQQNLALFKETVITESSSRQGEVEAAEPVPSTPGVQTGQTECEDAEAVVFHGLSMNSTEEVSNTRPKKQIQRSGFGNQDTSMGSSIRRSFTSRNAKQVAKSSSQGQGANVHRYGLRNFGCASISDILPSSSSSDSGRSRRVNMMKKRCPPEGESSDRGKKTGGFPGGASSHRNALCSSHLSSTNHLTSQPASRMTRNWPTGCSGVASVRTRRTINGDTSMRLIESDRDNVMSMPEHIMIPQLPQPEFSINESALASSYRSFPTELPAICQNSFRRPGSSNETIQSRPNARPEDSSTRPFHNFSLNRDGLRRFDMEGIAEVLLALERIEQDDELTYEQLLVLESNLFLGGLNFHDQHRGMRLDIDNMSYEELLALEEKMGTVSTALTEEELLNCLTRSCYAPAPLVKGIVDDTKCSICQEEYAVGDEVGKLGCEHRYHVVCIRQWLRQKNWCPICKSSAVPSPS